MEPAQMQVGAHYQIGHIEHHPGQRPKPQTLFAEFLGFTKDGKNAIFYPESKEGELIWLPNIKVVTRLHPMFCRKCNCRRYVPRGCTKCLADGCTATLAELKLSHEPAYIGD